MKATEIGAFEAKTHLSDLLDQASRGRVFLITKRGRPVAELRPAPPAGGRPRFGSDKGLVKIAPDFEEPLVDFSGYRG